MLHSVLLVDDDETDRHLLMRDLTRIRVDAPVLECVDGDEALRLLLRYGPDAEESPPRLIFLDINMPVVDGFGFLDAFAKLREQRGALKACRVLMFTSSDLPADRERALGFAFVAGYLVKGEARPGELDRAIQGALAV